MGQDGRTSNPADHHTKDDLHLSTHTHQEHGLYDRESAIGTYLAAQSGTFPAGEPAFWFSGLAVLHRNWAWALLLADPAEVAGGTQTAPTGLLVLGAAELRSLPRLRKASDIGLEEERGVRQDTDRGGSKMGCSADLGVRCKSELESDGYLLFGGSVETRVSADILTHRIRI